MSHLAKKGFSLVEILTVLSVLAALIIVSSLSVPSILARVRDAKRKVDIKRVALGIEEYRQDEECYPKAIPLCGNALANGDLVIIPKIPCDPKTKNSYVYVPEGSSCPSWFQLYGNLEYVKDKIIDKVGCREGCGPDCQFNFGATSTNQSLNPYCEDSTTISEGDGGNEEGGETITPPLQYVCAPGGKCETFIDPELSGCPDIYPNDPTCQDQCSDKDFWCHDDRGKTN